MGFLSKRISPRNNWGCSLSKQISSRVIGIPIQYCGMRRICTTNALLNSYIGKWRHRDKGKTTGILTDSKISCMKCFNIVSNLKNVIP
jgi:hypothetical protein